MYVVLIQLKCEEALNCDAGLSAAMSQKDKTEMVENARSIIVSCLIDKFLREVAEESITSSIWARLKLL